MPIPKLVAFCNDLASTPIRIAIEYAVKKTISPKSTPLSDLKFKRGRLSFN
jgi:hypothetical protein